MVARVPRQHGGARRLSHQRTIGAARGQHLAVGRLVDRERRRVTGAGILMKGEARPGAEGKGAAHRSPAIAAYGQRRLVLTVEGL
jgi:hypothetical protein